MTKIVLILTVSLLLLVSGCISPITTSPNATSEGIYTATPAPTATPVSTVTSTPIVTATLIAAMPTINVTSYPTSVQGEANFTIKWEVSGSIPGNISNTSILWGFNSGGENIADYPRSSAIQIGQTPRTFSADLKAPAGGAPVYFRTHAVVDGIDVYSLEYSIIIVPLYTGAGGSLSTASVISPVGITINPESQIVEKGQELVINISIDPINNPITATQFDLLFNGSLIEVKSVIEGNLFRQNGTNTMFNSGTINNTKGNLINAWGLIITPGASVLTKGNLATITIYAKDSGISPINLTNVIVSSPDSNAVQVNITNSSIEIFTKK